MCSDLFQVSLESRLPKNVLLQGNQELYVGKIVLCGLSCNAHYLSHLTHAKVEQVIC